MRTRHRSPRPANSPRHRALGPCRAPHAYRPILAALALAGLTPAAALAQFITPIGWSCSAIPDGCTPTCLPIVRPLGVNLTGQVVASVNVSACAGQPFFFVSRYDELPLGVDAPAVTLGDSFAEPPAAGINALGQFVTSLSTNPAQTFFDAFLVETTPATGTQIFTLTPGFANAINNLGVVGGGFQPPGGPGFSAYRHIGRPGIDGVLIAAALPPAALPYAEAFAINAPGTLAGVFSRTGTFLSSFLNTPLPAPAGTSLDIGTLPGAPGITRARAINDRGQIAGSTPSPFNFGPTAFRYDGVPNAGGVMHDLGSLAGALGFSEAFAITHDGAVVGTSDIPAGGSAPFIYLGQPGAGGAMINLDTWLDTVNPAAGAQWTLQSATAASPNGWIAGQGLFNGVLRAYLLDARSLITPCPTPALVAHPAPQSTCAAQPRTFTIATTNTAFAGYRWEWRVDAAEPWRSWTSPVVRSGDTIALLAAGDSPTLTITPTPAFPVGVNLLVRAVAATECGVLTSNPAAFTALPPAVFDPPPSAITVCPAGNGELAARVNAPDPITLTWTYLVPITGERRVIVDGANRDAFDRPLFLALGAASSRVQLSPPDALGGPRWTVPAITGIVLSAETPCGSLESSPITVTVCTADTNCSGALTVQDIFDFLTYYFAGDLRADANLSSTLTVQDIFDFLAAYFQGC